MPIDWTSALRRQKDIDATWPQKHGKRYKLIRKLKVSTASEHDTHLLEAMLATDNTSRAVYAGKGYVDIGREARLKGDGWLLIYQLQGIEQF